LKEFKTEGLNMTKRWIMRVFVAVLAAAPALFYAHEALAIVFGPMIRR
jgi:hypothetical protein